VLDNSEEAAQADSSGQRLAAGRWLVDTLEGLCAVVESWCGTELRLIVLQDGAARLGGTSLEQARTTLAGSSVQAPGGKAPLWTAWSGPPRSCARPPPDSGTMAVLLLWASKADGGSTATREQARLALAASLPVRLLLVRHEVAAADLVTLVEATSGLVLQSGIGLTIRDAVSGMTAALPGSWHLGVTSPGALPAGAGIVGNLSLDLGGEHLGRALSPLPLLGP